MNKYLKLFGLVALVAIITFSMAVCDSGTTKPGGSGDTSTQEEYKTYTAYDEAGNAYILVVTGNETYVLSIQKQNGTTLGSSTGTVTNSNNTSFTLKHKGGNTFIVTINGNIIVSINIPIPLDSGGTKSPEGELSSKKPGGNSNIPGNNSNPDDSSNPGDSDNNGTSWTVYDTNTWIEAVNGIRSGGNNKRHTITVTGDFTAQITTSALENTFGSVTGLTVTMEGFRTISQPEKNGSLLTIGREQTVIVKDLKLQGYNRNTSNSTVYVLGGGTFRMQGNASLTSSNGTRGVVVAGTYPSKLPLLPLKKELK